MRISNIVVGALFALALVLAYQNCGTGFRPEGQSELQSNQAPGTLVLSDLTTGSAQYSKARTVNVSIANDEGASSWCLTESAEPPSVACAAANGWQDERPGQLQLSESDGAKIARLWLKFAGDRIAASAVTAQIELDTTLPELTYAPENALANTNSRAFALPFTANDGGSGLASVRCALDGSAAQNCESPFTAAMLAEGPHELAVTLADRAGNTRSVVVGWRVDTTAPTVAISSMPANPTNQTAAAFAFSGTDGGAGVESYECKLDNAEFAVCVSPKAYTGLAAASHTFSVRARDRAGNVSAPQTFSWTISTTAPSLNLTATPSDPTSSQQASFTFTATGAGAISYACALDTAQASACTSPKTYSALSEGRHQFSVTATDAASNSSSLQFAWTVDRTPPAAQISSGPDAITNSRTARFAFAGTDALSGVARLEFVLDTGAYAAVNSPLTIIDLADGAHRFWIRAVDNAGNISPAVERGWTVDTAAPAAQITSAPSNPSDSNNATFAFTASDSGAGLSRIECRLDGAAFAACSSPVSYASLADGTHTFSVRALDLAGNVSAIALHTWTVRSEAAVLAQQIGDQYNCTLPANVGRNGANLGYAFLSDESAYALAKLMRDKNCFQNKPKSIIAYVSTVNFPLDGAAAQTGAADEQKWLDYWDAQMRKWGELGYEVWIHPFPFLLSPGGILNDTKPGMRWLVRNDLDLGAAAPEVYSCRDGRTTVIPSIYDPATMQLARRFYLGVKTFFSKYANFKKISIVPPSDFGEYGFPFGFPDGPAGWWQGTNHVFNCYKTGDSFARALIPADPPPAALYSGKLNEFSQSLTQFVKQNFPDKRYMVYMGYGNDDNPVDGFTYGDVTRWAVANGIELHSSHLGGLEESAIPLEKIQVAKPAGYPLSLEGYGVFGGYEALRNVYYGSWMQATVLWIYNLDYNPFTAQLHYSTGRPPATSLVSDKGIVFGDAGGLGALRSSYLTAGFIDLPKANSTINGDAIGPVGGWGYFNAPYGDGHNYGVEIYAGPLFEGSPYPGDLNRNRSVPGLHPQFMRRVATSVTNSARAPGGTDLSRFGANWKPDLASGKAVVRVYMTNGNAEIIAEHPQSPLIVEIASRVSGHYQFNRLPPAPCALNLQLKGRAVDSASPGARLILVVVDEYKGRVLGQGLTDTAGNFDFTLNVESSQKPLQVAPRVYVLIDNDGNGTRELVGLMHDMTAQLSNVGGYNLVANPFATTLAACQ
ncbi:MAG TPA: hypothetical protein VFV50_16935 [Bdellovibrionales bacterium]|nr:hypothetical protein [Bdellovibrionales bacterium]